MAEKKEKLIWEEYIVCAFHKEARELKITLCGLCGNSGILDTRETARFNGKSVGVIAYCVCPNGRSLKKDKFTVIQTDAECGAYQDR